MSSKTSLPLCFIDARGGEIARLGAAVAHSLGLSDAIALVWGEEYALSEDVKTALAEVGMTAPSVQTFHEDLTSKHSCIWLGQAAAEVPDAQVWPAALRGPEEPLFDRLVIARLLRDDIARRIRATRSTR